MAGEEPEIADNQSEQTDVVAEEERQRFLREQAHKPAYESCFAPGDLLAGRFEIVRFLARGGMGEVYEARDRLLPGVPIALKAILQMQISHAGPATQLEKEVLLARAIAHPNVCPIYDLFHCDPSHDCNCFLTMKLLRGETLAQRLRREKRIPLAECLLIMRQVCAALRAAHAAGVIHHDLKPGNIMLEGAGAGVKAVVTDFGLAREYEPDKTLSNLAHVPGTPGYIAPELYRGHSASFESDLYALGVVLHELFIGRKPANTPQNPLAFSAVELHKANIPKFCSQLIRGCLDPVPEIRKREFTRVLARFGLEDSASIAHLPDTRINRRRMLGVASAAAISAVAGVLVWKKNGIENWLHPLPAKRFVALMIFPPTSDANVKPIVEGVLDAIENELSRAEAFERNLVVIAAHASANKDASEQLKTVRDSLGVNLALTAQAATNGDQLRLELKLFDVSTSNVLRATDVVTSIKELKVVEARAVQTAAKLLNVRLRWSTPPQASSDTDSEEAYKAYQSAESSMKLPNDAGLDKALDEYKAALDADPKYAIAYAKLAVAYCRLFWLRGDPAALDLARANAEKGLALNKDLVYGHLALSSVYDLTGNKQQALAEISKALALDPTNPRTLFWQAQIYRRMNRWADAERIYQRIMRERPNYWPAYNDIGFILSAQGKYQEALKAFHAAAVAAPRAALAFNNLGDMYLKLGDFSRADENFRKSLLLNPNDLAYCNLARALRAQGRTPEALDLNLKAVNLNPLDDENWLDLADCYSAMRGKEKDAREAYDRARGLVKQVIQRDPSDGGAHIRLAFYILKTRQSGDVAALIKEAETLGLPDLDSQVMEARVYEQMGERGKALDLLVRCLKKGLTIYEIGFIPDFQVISKEPQLQRIAAANKT